MAPWRIATQYVTMKMPDGEAGPTLQFTINPANSAECRLRIVTPDVNSDVYEVVFTTGGMLVEQVYQPRILKPFARGPIVVPPEPVKVAVRAQEPEGPTELINPLTNRPETDDERDRREKLAALKQEREPTEADAKPAAGGPDSTDPNSPGAVARRSAEAGIDSTDAASKGMVSQQQGGQAGETAKTARAGQENAPNAVDQQLQQQGKAPGNPGPTNTSEVDTSAGNVGSKSPA